MLSRVFKSGNSMAVRIPKELAILSAAQEVEIERVGNTLVVRPLEQQSLQGIGAVFAMFSPDFMAEGREFQTEHERDWSATGAPRQQD
jgi:antitoxin VapB